MSRHTYFSLFLPFSRTFLSLFSTPFHVPTFPCFCYPVSRTYLSLFFFNPVSRTYLFLFFYPVHVPNFPCFLPRFTYLTFPIFTPIHVPTFPWGFSTRFQATETVSRRSALFTIIILSLSRNRYYIYSLLSLVQSVYRKLIRSGGERSRGLPGGVNEGHGAG